MATPRRRVSYVLPPSSVAVPRLALPSPGISRLGRTGPLLIHQDSAFAPVRHAAPGTQHRLGVSALALDDATILQGQHAPQGILYSGGRDGLVVGWDTGVGMRPKRPQEPQGDEDQWTGRRNRRRWELMTGWSDDIIDEDDEDEGRFTCDGDVLGDVAAFVSRQKRPKAKPETPAWEMDPASSSKNSQFRQSAQMHMDWINDIILCNNNQTVVSASSDGTIKAWNPHSSSQQPSKIGAHTDYVRCLAQCQTQNWIASGSFDRTIKLWDIGQTSAEPITTLNPIDNNAPKSSVYAIAADPYGRTIASGSPERVVRMWDPRSGKRISKLVGHTDNIRAILVSEDARYLLTGSADASIKLWSLASQRCLHTFTHHAESVWSLFSSSPTLESFYSGDRAGWVCRVDVEGCSDVAEGECTVLCRDGIVEGSPHVNGGVNAIVALDDQILWTASGSNSGIRKWNIPQRRSIRALALREEYSNISLESQSPYEQHFIRPPPVKKRSTDETSLLAPSILRGADEEEDGTLYGMPYESLIKLVSPFPYISTGGKDPEVATLYSVASVMSLRPMHPSSSALSPPFSPQDSAEAAYHSRELASEATPLLKAPSELIPGAPGLVRASVLNDRIHAITVDTNGEVAVWDLVKGLCRGVFSKNTLREVMDAPEAHPHNARKALEAVRSRIEGEGVTSPWANVETKAGVLTVHINDRCFEAEIYADEVGYKGRGFHEDSKLNIGKWVLRNLFLGLMREESRIRRRSKPIHVGSLETSSPLDYAMLCAPTMIPAIAAAPSPPAVHASLRTPLIPIQAMQLPAPAMVPSTSLPITSPGVDATPMQRRATVDSAKGEDYFTVRRQNSVSGSDDPGTTPGGGLMGRLKHFGKSKATRPTSDIIPSSSPVVEEPEDMLTPMPIPIKEIKEEETKEMETAKSPLEELLSFPLTAPPATDAPIHSFPPGTRVLISDEDGWGSWTIKFHGTPYLPFSQFWDDAESVRRVIELRSMLPGWLVEFLYQNKLPPAPAQVKVSFVLQPWRDELPELLNATQSKLTANRYLRVRKLVLHVQDKLDKLAVGSSRGSMEDHHLQYPSHPGTPQAEQPYEIVCNDVVLPLDMTLAAVRQYQSVVTGILRQMQIIVYRSPTGCQESGSLVSPVPLRPQRMCMCTVAMWRSNNNSRPCNATDIYIPESSTARMFSMFLGSAGTPLAWTVVCLLAIRATGHPLKVTPRGVQGRGESMEVKNTVAIGVGTPPRSLRFPPGAEENANRVIMYYQTHFQRNDNDQETEDLVDPLPLVGQITHLILGAFHLNEDKPDADKVTLNDHVPSHNYFRKLWPAIKEMQEKGVKVLGMLGGAAPGTYPMLTGDNWDTYYPALKKVITDYKLDGMDLDVEEYVSLETIERIIETLKKDFGDTFIITLTPVASALYGGSNLSGFNYLDLEKGKMKDKINFYNAQFYSGFGKFTHDDYVKVTEGGIDASRITATVLTDPRHGYGFLETESVKSAVEYLTAKYGTKWGGVGGWEYVGPKKDWAQTMHDAIQKGIESKNETGRKQDVLQGRNGMKRVRFSREWP